VPAVVSVNRFSADNSGGTRRLKELCARQGVEAIVRITGRAARRAADLARAVVALADSGKAKFQFLYPDEMPLWDKIGTIAQRLYGASDIEATAHQGPAGRFEKQGFGHFPICIAKTQFSFTTDANIKGRPAATF